MGRRQKTAPWWLLGLIAVMGTPLIAGTWLFENTTLQGTHTGDATVTGYITVTGSNFNFPVDITLTGPFGTVTDTGSGLQLDEGSASFADTLLDFIASQSLATTTLTTVPLSSFTYTNTTSPVDTYSLVSGSLTQAPEPGTAEELMVVAPIVLAAWAWRRHRRLG